MNKKLLSVLLMLLLVVSMVPAAFAENDTTNETTSDEDDDSAAESSDSGSTNASGFSGIDADDDSDDVDDEAEDETSEDDEAEEEEASEDEVEETDADNEEESSEEDEEEVSEDEVTEEDEEEVEDFEVEEAGSLRFLQLERAILRNLLIADAVIAVVEENGDDTTDLEVIASEIEDLLEEVQSVDLDQEPSDLASTWVDLKKASVQLTQDFKEAARELLSEEDKQSVRSSLDLQEDLAEIDALIKEARQDLHAAKLERLLEAAGIEDEDLIEQIRNGEVSIDDVKKRVRNSYSELSPEEKAEARRGLKAEVVKRAAKRAEISEKVADEFPRVREARKAEIASNKLEKRSNIADIRSDRLDRKSRVLEQAGFQRAADRAERASDRLERKSDVLERASDRVEETGRAPKPGAVKERIQDRRAAVEVEGGDE